MAGKREFHPVLFSCSFFNLYSRTRLSWTLVQDNINKSSEFITCLHSEHIKTPLNVHENSQTDISAKRNTSFRILLCSFHLLRSYNRYCFLKMCCFSLLMFIYVRVCFLDTVKSIKLSRKMFVLLSKDDRCRFYLLRLLVEGVLQKVKLNRKKKPGQPFFAYDYNSSL